MRTLHLLWIVAVAVAISGCHHRGGPGGTLDPHNGSGGHGGGGGCFVSTGC